MKKFLILFFALALSFGGFAQNFCNDSIPKWGESLGVVSFKTERIWKVGNQEWSDEVVASACQKTTYYGGNLSQGIYNYADCRSNSDYGDLFSWCAVVRFQNELCPTPWRVPTTDDFKILHLALNGMDFDIGAFGKYDYIDTIVLNRYLNDWGGSYGGFCFWTGELEGKGRFNGYWSQSEYIWDSNHGLNLQFYLSGAIDPQGRNVKTHGFTLRCVRDN